jgi:hypothetical protein
LTGFGLARVKPRIAALQPPFTIIGSLSGPSGLGQAARLAIHALRRSGVDCRAVDLTPTLLQPTTEPSIDLPPPEPGPGTLLFYVTPPNAAVAIRSISRELRRDKTLVAGWVCETNHLPPVWKRQAKYFHLLTAPTRFAGKTLAESTGRPVRLLGHPVEAEPWPPPPERSRLKYPVVGSMLDVGSSASRKNVAGLVETLLDILSASTNVTVRLKVRDLSTDQAAATAVQRLRNAAPDRIDVIRTDDSREAAIAFFDDLDILVSLSRAEGFALPYAEAIRRGVTVAAPRWSGPAEFLDDSNSIELPYQLIPIDDPSGLYVKDMGAWADVDPATAAQAVLQYINRPRPEEGEIVVPPIASTTFFMDCLLGSELL